MPPRVLIIEPFFGGAHKQLLDTILDGQNAADFDVYTLPAKKLQCRARTSALYFSQCIATEHEYQVLFTSSVLNLAELLGVRPDLQRCRKIVYFHDNQLVCPAQQRDVVKDRDSQFGWNQIMTCLAADVLLFNSYFNRNSFLCAIPVFLQQQAADMKLRKLHEKITPKCEVLYFPVRFHQMPKRYADKVDDNGDAVLHLIWPHRWETDKNPQLLTETLLELHKRQVPFRASIVGDHYQAVPECFDGIREKLGGKLVNFGLLGREEYINCLLDGDVVISTAGNEFYGVSMLEAAYCGCLPLAPNKLVYPELYPVDNLYNTSNQLIKTLYNWCRQPLKFAAQRDKFFEFFSFEPYSALQLVPKFLQKMLPEVAGAAEAAAQPE